MTGPVVCSKRVAASVPAWASTGCRASSGGDQVGTARRGRRPTVRVEVLAAVGQVAAVDREGGQQLGQRLGLLRAVDAGQLADHPDQPGDLRAEDAVGDLALAVVHQLARSRPCAPASSVSSAVSAASPAGSTSTSSTSASAS